MIVIFGYMVGGSIDSVFWQTPDADHAMVRTLRSDGVITDKALNHDLSWVMNRLSSSQYWMYAAQLDDVRTAYKYLGKNPDLVELLPEAEF
jgi:hypothetical protein